jgi:hypothetical protein
MILLATDSQRERAKVGPYDRRSRSVWKSIMVSWAEREPPKNGRNRTLHGPELAT